jgi:CrcB protein
MNAINLLAVAGGGALGSLARYLVSIGAGKILGPSFPCGTLIVNITGSFLMGILIEGFALRWNAPEAVRVFLMIGICGGFTTFSAFSSDTVYLLTRGTALPLAYIIASITLSVGALYAGLWLMRAALS